jgi:hypothetical protein
MLSLIEHFPDIYLDEIQEQLRDLHDVDVSLATIYQTLKRLGIGSKKVCGLILYRNIYKYVNDVAVESSC